MGVKSVEWSYVKPMPLNKVKCKFCEKIYWGSPVRIRAHILGNGNGVSRCPDPSHDAVMSLGQSDRLKCTIGRARQRSQDVQKVSQLKAQKTLLDCNSTTRTDAASKAIAKFLYTEGIALKKVDSKAFKNMIQKVALCGVGYSGPSRKAVSTKLLDSEYEEQRTTCLSSFKGSNVTLAIDGWKNVASEGYVNFCIGSSNQSMFYKAVDVTGTRQTSEFLSDLLIDCVTELKEEHDIVVVSICTDSASNMVLAKSLVQGTYPNIFVYACCAHTVDLLLKDIAKLTWAKEIFEDANDVVTFVRNRSLLIAFVKEKSENNKGLKCPAKTRFMSQLIVFRRLLDQRSNLEQLFVSDIGKHVYSKCDKDGKVRFKKVKDLVLGSDFWDDLEYLVHIYEAPGITLRISDGYRHHSLGFIYNSFLSVQTTWKESTLIDKNHKESLLALLTERWAMAHTPLHSVCFMLHPLFHNHTHFGEDAIIADFKTVVKTLFPNSKLGDFVKELDSYKKFNCAEAFENYEIKDDKDLLDYQDPLIFWNYFAEDVPNLKRLATIIMPLFSSSSICETNFSHFDYIFGNKRLRLKSDRANKLIFLYSNSKVQTYNL